MKSHAALGTCFFCGEEDGTVILDKRLRPVFDRQVCASYEPCEKCQEIMKQGVTLIEADSKPITKGQPAMQTRPEKTYPTGRWLVLKEEAWERMFNVPLPPQKRAFASNDVFERLLEAGKEVNNAPL